ncbi:MAG: hypothetical protein AAGA95_11150, partial [Pseudomonadota bacterium]
MSRRVLLLPGDYIGREIVPEATRVLELMSRRYGLPIELEEGLIGPDDTVWCPGYLDVSGRRFHCWKRGGHGH